MDTLSGTASVKAPVLRKLAVNQLSNGGMQENENESAIMKTPYRALNDVGGRAPNCIPITLVISSTTSYTDQYSPSTMKQTPAINIDTEVPTERISYLSESQATVTVTTKAMA